MFSTSERAKAVKIAKNPSKRFCPFRAADTSNFPKKTQFLVGRIDKNPFGTPSKRFCPSRNSKTLYFSNKTRTRVARRTKTLSEAK